MEGISNEEIKALYKVSELASEDNTSMISVHNAAAVLSPVGVVDVSPYTNNDTRSFTKLIESEVEAAANQNSGARLLNWAVYCVYL